ncbi:hypothetical protein ACFZDG_05640 [Kitasatospora xanthocidica]|uniref:hypothetical protein n=1 Tax=Kitasatospora xanthocidica TaxID=83382 RepID=UPI0036ED42E7
MSCLFQGLAGIAGGVGGVAEGVDRFVLLGEQFEADGSFVVLGPGTGPQGHGGEQAGLFLTTDRFHASCTISSTAAAPISSGVAKSRVSEAALPSKPNVRST